MTNNQERIDLLIASKLASRTYGAWTLENALRFGHVGYDSYTPAEVNQEFVDWFAGNPAEVQPLTAAQRTRVAAILEQLQ